MSDQVTVVFPTKGAGRLVRQKIAQRNLFRLQVMTSSDRTLVDLPINLDLRVIPKVFTPPMQALGIVASTFARLTGVRIILNVDP